MNGNGLKSFRSASRWLLMSSAGLITFVWFSVIVGIAFFGLEWDNFSGALEWGKNFFFLTALPYISNKISTALNNKNKE